MYRVFGSPYNLSFHQSTNYLRHKKVPFKVHNGSLTTTKLLSLWHRAKMSFCTLSPKRETLLLIHQLLERCEAETAVANRKAFAEQPKANIDKATSENRSDDGANGLSSLVPETILINSEMYPRLSLASWSMFLYFSSWLGSTGSLYRWVHGTGSSVVDDYVAYLSRATSIIPGAGALVSPRIRNLMVSTLAEIGITKEAEPYMIEHFMRLCDALEEHFVAIGGPARAETINEESSQISSSDGAGTTNGGLKINSSASPYILGTSHPTLADVAMAAAFDGYFLRDDPPALDTITKYPALNRYLGLISELGASNAFELALSRPTQRSGADDKAEVSEAQDASSATPILYMRPLLPCQNSDNTQIPGVDGCDYVSETLQPILDLMAEIFPWQIAQCDAIKQFYQRGLDREKTSVVDVASELPLLLWGRSGVVGENDEEPPAVDYNSTSDQKAKPLMPSGVASGKVTAKVVTPKLKAAPYIMLVDRSIIPAHARCQEIELAQVCAMGAIGAYPLFTTNADDGKDSTKATSIKSCCGCSDAYLAGLQQTSPSDALYALAAKLLRESDEALDVELIDFDTHHVKSAEAMRGASGDSTVGATGAMAFQNVKLRARQVGQREQRHVYDVKKARALASASSASEAEGKKSPDEASEKTTNLVGTAEEEGDKPSAQPPIDRIESDELLRPSGSIDYALARVAMLLGRMYVKDFEVRSVYRSRGIEFAIIPRKVAGAGRG